MIIPRFLADSTFSLTPRGRVQVPLLLEQFGHNSGPCNSGPYKPIAKFLSSGPFELRFSNSRRFVCRSRLGAAYSLVDQFNTMTR